MRVFISGLTAAGKTTHSVFLAEEFSLQYISASSQLMKQFNKDPLALRKDFWFNDESIEIRDARKRDRSADQATDLLLIAYAAKLEAAVFDTWALPWITQVKGLRIWLESSLTTRCWKAYISHSAGSKYVHDRYEKEIIEKDFFTRKLFLDEYGFDIFQDLDIFDYILNISSFITAPTKEASSSSIEKVQELISSIIMYHTTLSARSFSELQSLFHHYGIDVFKKTPL
jgi:cytidylate kinase